MHDISFMIAEEQSVRMCTRHSGREMGQIQYKRMCFISFTNLTLFPMGGNIAPRPINCRTNQNQNFATFNIF